MSEGIKNTDEKLAKAKVIDGMLVELDMSRQDLIDLIKILTEQSISEDKGLENISDIELKELAAHDEIGALSGSITVEELANHIASGDLRYLAKYLSLEQMNKLAIKVGFAFSLKRAKDLGIVLDMEKISQMIGVAGVSRISPDGNYTADGKDRKLSSEQADKISLSLSDVINSRQSARSSFEGRQILNQNSQAMNDPNDLSNQNSSVNVVRRIVSSIQMQLQSLGLPGGANAAVAGTTLQQNIQQQQQQQAQQMQNIVVRVQRINAQMRRHERKMKNMFPEISKMHSKGGQVFASVRTKGGEKEVNLRDHLRENKKLTPKADKILKNYAQMGDKLELNLGQLSKGLPESKSFQFDASGKLQVVMEEDNKVKLYNVVDYINDLKRDFERLKNRVENKKQEAELKKNEAEALASGSQHSKDLTKGPELDKASLEASKLSAERDMAMNLLHAEANSKENEKDTKTEKKEIKRVGDELIKLDAMHDRMKMMESLKATGEMKAIESSMKDVMKHMDEAEKNKDLLKDMQLNKKDKFIDKS